MGLMHSPKRRPSAAQAPLQAAPWTPVTALLPLPVSVGSGATPPGTTSAAAGARNTQAGGSGGAFCYAIAVRQRGVF